MIKNVFLNWGFIIIYSIIDASTDVRFTQSRILVVGVLLTSLAGAVGFMFKALMKAKDDQYIAILKDKETLFISLETERNTFKSMAISAITNLEVAANIYRQKSGQAPLPKLVPVVPECNSPPSEEQIVTANIATLRARMVASMLSLGLPARTGDNEADEIIMENLVLQPQVEEIQTNIEVLKENTEAVRENTEAIEGSLP